MALKDWKKDVRYKNHFINKVDKNSIAIVFDYIGFENKWLVVIYNKYKDTILDRAFKTKSEALKFAKSYMRRH